jgi:small conductance mechanosensitive channel
MELRGRLGAPLPQEEDSGATLMASQRHERLLRRSAFLVKLLQVLRIALVVMAVTLALHLFPGTRLAAAFLIQQSVGLPTIWIAMVLLESLLLWAVMRRLNRWAVDAQALEPTSRRPQLRLETNARVLKGTIAVGSTILGIYLTVMLFGIDPQILAGAGILAVALGFLARGVVEDLVGGIRILATDRFAIGDSIAVEGHAGAVEEMNLLHTQLRGGEGQVVTIPNGMIRVLQNRSKEWARVNFEIDIAWDSDLERACAVLQEVAAGLAEDPDWRDQILEPPQLLGVERLEQSGVRLKLWIKTQPLKQWGVARELRHRLKPALDAADIEPGVPQTQNLLRRH